MIDLEHVLVVGALLFSIGLYVALSRRNAVGILMGIELMLNSVNLNLIGFARFVDSPRPRLRSPWRWPSRSTACASPSTSTAWTR